MIIDANTHITSDGKWFSSALDASEREILRQMDEVGVDRAALVGLPGVTANKLIMEVWKRTPHRFIPVASFNPASFPDCNSTIRQARACLQGKGFAGVKLHPRFGRYSILNDNVLAFLSEIEKWEDAPVVWLCTFLYYFGGTLSKSPVEMIHEIVGRYPKITFILLHAGGPDALRLAFALRDAQNAFLDTSYTVTKYRGSSVDADMAYLFQNFDRRLLFGSDFPEVTLAESLDRFNTLSAGLDEEKRSNILGGNLKRILENRR